MFINVYNYFQHCGVFIYFTSNNFYHRIPNKLLYYILCLWCCVIAGDFLKNPQYLVECTSRPSLRYKRLIYAAVMQKSGHGYSHVKEPLRIGFRRYLVKFNYVQYIINFRKIIVRCVIRNLLNAHVFPTCMCPVHQDGSYFPQICGFLITKLSTFHHIPYKPLPNKLLCAQKQASTALTAWRQPWVAGWLNGQLCIC